MATDVKSELAQIVKEVSEPDLDILDVYWEMEKHEVDLQDDQAMAAIRVMLDVWIDVADMQSKPTVKIYKAFKEKIDSAKSTLKAKMDKLSKVDTNIFERIREYGVDSEEEQVKKVLQAMNGILIKKMEIQSNTLDKYYRAMATHALGYGEAGK
jgi:hypothetical protein